MQLDKTEIVIRERTARELFDLSLIVLKNYAGPIFYSSLILAVPMLVIDVLAVAWMLSEDAYLAAEAMSGADSYIRVRYLVHLTGLFVIQFPLLSLPTTILLGSRIFYESIDLKGILNRLREIAFRVILVLGVYRLGLVTLVLTLMISRDDFNDPSMETMIAIGAFIALIVRAVRPFAPEILALELCPLGSKDKKRITYAQRSKSLHRMSESDNLGRFMNGVIVSVLLTAMTMGFFLSAKGLSTGNWSWTPYVDFVLVPATLWLVGMFMSIFRFLAYLDSRIRQEGWEIELRLKAEATRLRQQNQEVVDQELIQEPVAS